MAEQYRRWSPYTYAVNNPIRFIDPDGMSVSEGTKGGLHIDGDDIAQVLSVLKDEYGGKKPKSNTDGNSKGGAWEIKNKWNDSYIAKYREYVSQQAPQCQRAMEKYTCEDFALHLLICFAKNNNLPLKLKNKSGTYDASKINTVQ